MTDTPDLSDIEQHLSEKRLEAKDTRAAITDVRAEPQTQMDTEVTEPGVVIGYESVAGSHDEVWLPVVDEYDPGRSDLVTVIEYLGADPNNLDSLEGQRVPFSEDRIRFDVMRQVLESAEAASDEWDREKRQRKAQAFIDGGL